MAYTDHIPASRIEPFAWLGKWNWITPTRSGYRRSKEIPQILKSASKIDERFHREVSSIVNLSIYDITSGQPKPSGRTAYSDIYFMASKALSGGQKTIQLSQACCEAFENTSLTLDFQHYRQPYPTMLVGFPENYAQAKFVPGKGEYPHVVAIHYEEQEQVLVFEAVLQNSQVACWIPCDPNVEIESSLEQFEAGKVVGSDEVDFEAADTGAYLAAFCRVALNAMVAMTYGKDWGKLTPTKADEQNEKKLRKKSRSKDDATARRAKLRLGTIPEVFEFSQTIKAFEVERNDSGVGKSHEVNRKKPHWRRGHWRNQAVGQGRSQRELRWILPILINAAQFKGDLKDTSTTYVT